VSSRLQPIRGMNDVLPEQMAPWAFVEATVRDVLRAYGYDEIRVPVVEQTDLFKRAIGEHTDVVEKEMFTFVDQGGDSLTLRPEATAGVVRSMISNGLLRGARHKLWTAGPMFRHERPQKGRYRQFHQVSVEAIGFAGPDIDAELIAIGARLWKRLGIDRVALEINSLGTAEARRAYRALLADYFRGHEARLDADSRRRLEGNPLRILDSKNPDMQAIVAGAPSLADHLDPESARISRCCASASMRSACLTPSIHAWCADSITIRARCSSGSPMRSAHRTRSARAVVTMA
jgi:histidyl-tRNA synthetase